MGYLTITSRHHDGFSTCDTALSDYKITNAARVGFYVAFLDWDHLADRERFRRKNGVAGRLRFTSRKLPPWANQFELA